MKKRVKSITLWPNLVASVPRVIACPIRRGTGPFIESEDCLRESAPRLVHLPDELYLRDLHRLELSDDAALASFMDAYGTMQIPSPESLAAAITRNLPRAPDPTLFRSQRDVVAPDWLSSQRTEVRDHVEQVNRAWFRTAKKGETTPPMLSAERSVHVDEFREAVRLLRDLTRIYWMLQGLEALSIDDLQAQWECHFRPQNVVSFWPEREEAAVFLATVLTHALQPFRLRVQCAGMEEPPGETFACLALQLANHIAEGAQYQVCENERCRNLFVRQQGRGVAKRQGRETGVHYCSVACANAVAQRRFRDRRREQLELLRNQRAINRGGSVGTLKVDATKGRQ